MQSHLDDDDLSQGDGSMEKDVGVDGSEFDIRSTVTVSVEVEYMHGYGGGYGADVERRMETDMEDRKAKLQYPQRVRGGWI